MLTTANSGVLVGGGASPRRQSEQQKYARAYKNPGYKMGLARMSHAREVIYPMRGSLLDVGCGRGEMIRLALNMGFAPVMGVEVVPDLCDGKMVVPGEVTDIPFLDSEFDCVTMFDVMEHLPPEDSELACKELQRVARKNVVLTVANFPHVFDGMDLHVNIKPYEEWDSLFRKWFAGTVEWLPRGQNISETWRIRL